MLNTVRRLSFSVAGLSFCLVSEATDRPLSLPAEYTPFVAENPTLDDCSGVYDVAAPGLVSPPLIAGGWLWQNDLWRLGSTADRDVLIELNDTRRHEWRGVGCFRDEFHSGTLYTRDPSGSPSPLLPFHHPHDMAVILSRLAFIGGGVVHSSCIAVDGKALLFIGSSGAGKTTLARLWRDAGATILNDERNIIRTTPQGPLAGASPWHGEENQVSPVTAPLAGVFYLKQADSNAVREIPCTESVTRLFTNTVVPVFLQDGPRMVLNAWADVLETVPSFELSFTRDHRALATCLSAIAKG